MVCTMYFVHIRLRAFCVAYINLAFSKETSLAQLTNLAQYVQRSRGNVYFVTFWMLPCKVSKTRVEKPNFTVQRRNNKNWHFELRNFEHVHHVAPNNSFALYYRILITVPIHITIDRRNDQNAMIFLKLNRGHTCLKDVFLVSWILHSKMLPRTYLKY